MPIDRARFGLSVGVVMCALAGVAPAEANGPSDPFGLSSNQWQAGGFVYIMPNYEGGKGHSVIAFPFAAPVGLGDSGFVQIKGIDDVRFRLFQNGGFEFGPLIGYRFGRDEDDAGRLTGMGDVDGGLVAGAFAAYRAGPFAASISYHHQATGDETGGLVRFGLEHVQMMSPRVKITTSLGTNYATEDYMASFFGVTAAQSVSSGLAQYDASAGFKDVYAGITANIDLTDRWSLMLMGRYARLIGDAADSPVIETENQFYGGVGLSYKFSTR
jgi:outer membrane protein